MKKFKNESIKQLSISQSLQSGQSVSNEQKEFNLELCKTLIKSNIPLKKLQNNNLKTFLEKHCKMRVPDESTLRKNYVCLVYKETIEEIKSIIGNNCIWFSVDETTDTCGRYIANLVIGVLNEEIPTKGFLITTKELNKTNSNTITKFINDGLTSFYLPDAVPSNKILLMLSDAATYMVKAASNMKIFYENLVHCTCLAHGLNRIAETIRLQFPLINDLIRNGKKIFLKAPLRVQLFKEELPDVPLPPEPVLTRWGSWLDAAIYYANNFESFKHVVFQFPESVGMSVKDCQTVLKNKELENNLTFIKAHYSFVSHAIKSLEKQELSLSESVKIINDFKDAISKVPGRIGQEVKLKSDVVFLKNEGFSTLSKISTILNGGNVSDLDMDPASIAKFKYAPITSVEVERSFSAFKNILSDRRQNFTVEHIEQHLIINCFHE